MNRNQQITLGALKDMEPEEGFMSTDPNDLLEHMWAARRFGGLDPEESEALDRVVENNEWDEVVQAFGELK